MIDFNRYMPKYIQVCNIHIERIQVMRVDVVEICIEGDMCIFEA